MYYILDADKKTVPATIQEVAPLFTDIDHKRVAYTEFGSSDVSTVFLFIDHGFGADRSPLLFETLVFGGPLANEMDRYSTWDEAVAGHEAMVARVKKTSQGMETARVRIGKSELTCNPRSI